jgi:hypothetical protein
VADKVGIEECRRILGASAESKTDEQIEKLRDELGMLANEMYDSLTQHAAVDRESIAAASADVPGFPATSEEQLRRDAIDHMKWKGYAHYHSDEDIH